MIFIWRFSVPTQNPLERLGCHPQTGFSDITSHIFFKAIDWEAVSILSFFFWVELGFNV